MDPTPKADEHSSILSGRLLPCPVCGKRALLVELTAEDIQRTYPPRVSLVCVACREKHRSAARLEIDYPTRVALRELVLTTIAIFSTIILFSYLLLSVRLSLPVGTSEILFFTTAATSLTGLKMTYNEVGGRYAFTHNLRWSLHSRYGMVSISLVLSGVLAAIFLITLF